VQGWTPILVLAVSSAVLGSSAQFGYNTGVYNSPQDVRNDTVEPLNPNLGTISSSFNFDIILRTFVVLTLEGFTVDVTCWLSSHHFVGN